MTARLTPDERRQFGRRFADLIDQGVLVPEIVTRFEISRQTVRRCLLAHDIVEAKVAIKQPESLLDRETIAMLHKFRDEIKAADRLATARES